MHSAQAVAGPAFMQCDAHAVSAIQTLLVLGLVFTLIVLLAYVEYDSRQEAKAAPARVPVEEECKLHSRRLSDCTRLGYHSPADDEEDGDAPSD